LQNNTFSTLFVGQNLIKLSEVDSTNNFLKGLVSNSEPLPEGTVIMADNQFAGRGQQQNSWVAEPGKNLTFSLYFKPTFLNIQQQFLFNMAISNGLAEALTTILGAGVKIKWPNDIYYNDQKLVGILIENLISGHTYKSSIVGIGINVNQQKFDPALKNRATSIWQILQKDVSLMGLLSEICNHIEADYLRLKADRYIYLQKAYLEKLYRFGALHNYRHNGEIFEGRIVNVKENGAIVLEIGETEKDFLFKEVEFII
jgi:BirA family biotin operon repressor/biotin-[acetyl-CoA-carboxylase] ligase